MSSTFGLPRSDSAMTLRGNKMKVAKDARTSEVKAEGERGEGANARMRDSAARGKCQWYTLVKIYDDARFARVTDDELAMLEAKMLQSDEMRVGGRNVMATAREAREGARAFAGSTRFESDEDDASERAKAEDAEDEEAYGLDVGDRDGGMDDRGRCAFGGGRGNREGEAFGGATEDAEGLDDDDDDDASADDSADDAGGQYRGTSTAIGGAIVMGHQKPGGPCDHCGALDSPQWRRGPSSKPMLCNACGTRFRRTGNLGSSPLSRCPTPVATPTKRKAPVVAAPVISATGRKKRLVPGEKIVQRAVLTC